MTTLTAPTQTVFTAAEAKELSFASLTDATDHLKSLLAVADTSKLAAARTLQAISRQRLYTEIGFESFEAFIPSLVTRLENVSWGARSIKNWLAFTNLYLDELAIEESAAVKAASHLHALYVLADVDRKTGTFADVTKDGKLEPAKFEGLSEAITLLVGLNEAHKATGLDDEATLALFVEADRVWTAETFTELAGFAPFIPIGGWTVAHTKELISTIRGEDEAPAKAVQIWYLSFKDEERAEVARLAWSIDGEEIDSQDWNRAIPLERFLAISKGDQVIDGSAGTKDGEDDGYSGKE